MSPFIAVPRMVPEMLYLYLGKTFHIVIDAMFEAVPDIVMLGQEISQSIAGGEN